MPFSIQRVLAIVNGKVAEYVAAATSSGTSTAGALIAANSSGVLDATFLPPGAGPSTQQLTASEAIAAGAPVNLWSNAGVPSMRNADGSTTGKQADGFVLAAVQSGTLGTAYFTGVNTAVTGLTPGPVYLGTTAGSYAAAGASGAGQTYQQVGVATATGALNFEPQYPILRN